jgi:hypothetical protein
MKAMFKTVEVYIDAVGYPSRSRIKAKNPLVILDERGIQAGQTAGVRKLASSRAG